MECVAALAAMLALDLNTVVFQYAHDALWCRAAVGIFSHRHSAETEARHAVHVLVQVDGIETSALVNLLGRRMLQQDAVHVRVCVELLYSCQ